MYLTGPAISTSTQKATLRSFAGSRSGMPHRGRYGSMFIVFLSTTPPLLATFPRLPTPLDDNLRSALWRKDGWLDLLCCEFWTAVISCFLASLAPGVNAAPKGFDCSRGPIAVLATDAVAGRWLGGGEFGVEENFELKFDIHELRRLEEAGGLNLASFEIEEDGWPDCRNFPEPELDRLSMWGRGMWCWEWAIGAPLESNELSTGWWSRCGKEVIVCSFSSVRSDVATELTAAGVWWSEGWKLVTLISRASTWPRFECLPFCEWWSQLTSTPWISSIRRLSTATYCEVLI